LKRGEEVKTYEITIKPQTSFGTPLKGDTIFGHFCWQIACDDKLAGKTLDELLLTYDKEPFIIFSSAYPKYCSQGKYHYALKTPDIPLDFLFEFSTNKIEKVEKRKEFKAKKWMILKEDEKIESLKKLPKLNNSELFKEVASKINKEARKKIEKSETKSFIIEFTQFHNKINRLTGKTGEEGFAPYSVEQYSYLPNMELALFVGFNERVILLEQVIKVLERIGEMGFGKDASSGLGRFQVGEETEIDLKKIGSASPDAVYGLSPFVPEKETYSHIYFTPFTRYGKHGDILSKSENPFKNPLIMADEGAIAIPQNKSFFDNCFIGRAIRNLSKCENKTVAQGYSLFIPVKLEG